MKTGNYKEVYITHDSAEMYGFNVWNPNIGIVKYEGCVEFRSAKSFGGNGIKRRFEHSGRLEHCCACSACGNNRDDIEDQFGFIPKRGTAWLVNTTTLKRTRVDKDMALIDPDNCTAI